MSLKFIIKIMIQEIKEPFDLLYKQMHTAEYLTEISFLETLPAQSFLLEDEPLYSFWQTIKQTNYHFKNYKYTEIGHLLMGLFEEHNIGKERLNFSDFIGVTNSSETEKNTFAKFKELQYEENLNKKLYIDYTSLRHDIFNTDRYGNSSILMNAKRLTWTNSVYANNRDRSHRFATLCKWDEIENLHDSEIFNVTEISLNEEIKKIFLQKYDGFLLNNDTLADIEKNRNIILKSYNSDYRFNLKNTNPNINNIGFLIFKKKDINNEIRNIFILEPNCIYINKLLEKY